MVTGGKKITAVFLLFAAVLFTAAQEKKDFYYSGRIGAMGTISPGFRTSDGTVTMSLHGYLEYFMEEHASWRGDGFYYLGEQRKPGSLYQNSSLLWGPFYHWHPPAGRLDFYLGLQPGLNFVQPMGQDINGRDYYYTFKVVPVASGTGGLNFHFGNFFNMFLEGTYIGGRYLGDGFTKINVSEFRISAGLGFHIATGKKGCGCNK